MKITIVTICYNAIQSLERTILSVVNQKNVDVDYVIIDGGSTDGCVDLIKKYSDRISYCVSEPDKGIYDAMNKGINKASGEWINFMNAGDEFANPSVLEKISLYFTPEADVVFGDIIVTKQCNSYICKANPHAIKDFSNLSMGFNHQASFVRTSLAKSTPFDLKFRLAADYNMMVSLYIMGKSFVYCGFPVAIYDLTGVSSQHFIQHKKECLEINHPHRLINPLIANYLGIKHWIKLRVIDILSKMNISLLDKYYTHKTNYIIIKD